jgi:hypothetical protein
MLLKRRKNMKFCQKLGLVLMGAILIMATACSSATPAPATMAGFWLDNASNVTTIQSQNDGYVAVTTYYMFASRSQNSLVSSSYENGILTWKYCPPAKPCITMQTVSFNGDTLDVTWTNDNGESGQMTLTRTDLGKPSE